MDKAEAKLKELRTTVSSLDAELYKKVVDRRMRLMMKAKTSDLGSNSDDFDVQSNSNSKNDTSDEKSVSPTLYCRVEPQSCLGGGPFVEGLRE